MRDDQRYDNADRRDRGRHGPLDANRTELHSSPFSRRPPHDRDRRHRSPDHHREKSRNYFPPPPPPPRAPSRQLDYYDRRSSQPHYRVPHPSRQRGQWEVEKHSSGETRGAPRNESSKRRSRGRNSSHRRSQSRDLSHGRRERASNAGVQREGSELDGDLIEETRRSHFAPSIDRRVSSSSGHVGSPPPTVNRDCSRQEIFPSKLSGAASRQTRSRSPSRVSSHASDYCDRDRSPHELANRSAGSVRSRGEQAVETQPSLYYPPDQSSSSRNLTTTETTPAPTPAPAPTTATATFPSIGSQSPSGLGSHSVLTRSNTHLASLGSRVEDRRGRVRDGEQSSVSPLEDGPLAAGASVVIEASMSSRGGHRGSYHGHMQSSYRNCSQSPQTGSHNDSPPPPRSPYASRGGWGGHQPYSQGMQQQYARGGNGGSNGHYSLSSQNSSSYSQSGSPSQQYSHGHRNNYRGSSGGGGGGGYRGNNRGGNRNFKSSQWGTVNQASGSRAHQQSDDARSQHGNQHVTQHSDAESRTSHVASEMEVDVRIEEEVASFIRSPPIDDAVAESPSQDKDASDAMPPPPSKVPPPPGPEASAGNGPKFSFAFNKSAFNKSSKLATVAPNAEISQKFNAAPRGRQPFVAENRERDVFKVSPTRTSSSRSKDEEQKPTQEPAIKADAPKVRMIKQLVQRKKPRPKVDPELAQSPSVYYRKPGDGSVIGSGTYGKVFKGLHVYTKNYVALKRIRMEGEKDGFPVTAIREIKLLQSLRHPNVVALLEVMVERNDCFMVFEYLSHDLTGILNHPTFKLNDAQRKHMAMQLFTALDYLHGRGVLHRDIKAANILVSKDGVLKLADFGLARFYDEKNHYDYTNRVVTIWYRSPELLLGETTYAAPVDVWSAACVMIEIFTGLAIFPGDGTEIHQISLIYDLLGSPSISDWPEIKDLPWIQLLKPKRRRTNGLYEKYGDKLTPAAFDLLSAMFRYNPAKRPLPSEVLQHPYFTEEEPAPRQAVELGQIEGEWHELESKALRKKQLKEARETRDSQEKVREKDRKRVHDGFDAAQRDRKRFHPDGKPRGDKERGLGPDESVDAGEEGKLIERPPSAKPAPLTRV